MKEKWTPKEQELIQVGRRYNQKKRKQETDQWWRNLISALVEDEADAIMREVNADPSLRDAQAPPEIQEKLFAQIREYEAQKNRDGQ